MEVLKADGSLSKHKRKLAYLIARMADLLDKKEKKEDMYDVYKWNMNDETYQLVLNYRSL